MTSVKLYIKDGLNGRVSNTTIEKKMTSKEVKRKISNLIHKSIKVRIDASISDEVEEKNRLGEGK